MDLSGVLENTRPCLEPACLPAAAPDFSLGLASCFSLWHQLWLGAQVPLQLCLLPVPLVLHLLLGEELSEGPPTGAE